MNIKAGYLTTELWLVIGNTVLDATHTMPAHAALPSALGAVAYALGRSIVKVSQGTGGTPQSVLTAITDLVGGKLGGPPSGEPTGKLGDTQPAETETPLPSSADRTQPAPPAGH